MEAKKIIITGGANRIGAAIAKKLSGPGVEIIIHYNKSKADAEKLKNELSKKLNMEIFDINKFIIENKYGQYEKDQLIIYELLVRDFITSHDFQTLIDTLNYLEDLGINAIQIMPFNEFEGNSSWGYNSSFYFAPDKYYGPKDALKSFIDEFIPFKRTALIFILSNFKSCKIFDNFSLLIEDEFNKNNVYENVASTLIKIGGRMGNLMDTTQQAMSPDSQMGKEISKKEKDQIFKAINEVEEKIAKLKKIETRPIR